ncbi:NrfD/PsrC family molybdoenzyme membrane anchor subunit [Thiohalomonas denitrificans]|uniref:Tetrathionate reductase subunit C n=1 Tax=Thiohalomonas denitrificans TaxID=415747 RepID=A0A1G5QN86_9GAMM|nr:NrfD/PsrC family molybdoenzyme membrane anchor subunit [Thiohalomonas denitrificans]SCZ62761.1 tetrathionate reductase subunit C [Thiohalomonas denitrificans]
MNPEVLQLTGFSQQPAWLPWAVQYFFIIGLSVGAFLITLPAYVLRWSSDQRAARAALLVALTTGLAAPVALLADLHQPDRFWHFYAFGQGSSWMAWGSFFLPAYVGLLTLYGWLALRPELAQRARDPGPVGRLAGLLAGSGVALPRARRSVGWVTAIAAALVALYTGAEVAVVAARPLWHSALLPVVYLTTGIAGGAGLALLFAGRFETPRRTLFRWLWAALALTGLAVFAWMLGLSGSGTAHALLRLATEYRPMPFGLWLLVGLLLPLVLAWFHRAPIAAGLLAIAGAWMWRWEIFMAGQGIPKNDAGFYGVHLPLGPEGLLGIVGTLGLWVLIALALTALLRPTANVQG